MKITGKTLKLGDHIDTDQIIPGKYLNISDPGLLAEHCLEGYDPQFPSRIKENTILIVGENFGCGSSREHAPIALKEAGVVAIIGVSFARIFFRNAINLGLPVIIAPEAAEAIQEDSDVEISLNQGEIVDLTSEETYSFEGYPPLIKKIIEKDGIEGYLKSN